MNQKFWKGKNVLITGATGFKGGWLALSLQMLGAKVTGVGLPAGTNGIFDDVKLHSLIDIKYIDILNTQEIIACVKECDPLIIFHLAAQALVSEGYADPIGTIKTNVLGTSNLLEAARQLDNLKCFVNVTTDKVYHNYEKVEGYGEEDALGGCDPYSASKAGSDIVARSYYYSYFRDSGIGLSNARAGNVLGGGDIGKDRLVPDFYRAVMEQKTLKIRSPSAIRPWQHVLDVVGGYICLAEKMTASPCRFSSSWNFGPNSNSLITVRDVLNGLSKFLDLPPKISFEQCQSRETAKLVLKVDRRGKS